MNPSFSSGFAACACSLPYQISLKFRYTGKDGHNHFTSDGVDGLHLTAESERKLGVAVATKVKEMFK